MSHAPARTEPHWTEPGAHPVDGHEGVHRIPLPLPMDGLRAVNVYVLETEDGLTLVDGGWAIEAARTALEDALAGIGHKVRDITRFLVTHVHRDHYTQAVAVRREFGAHVSLGLAERPNLELITDPTALEQDPTLGRLERAGAERLARSWAKAFAGGRPPTSDYEMPDAWLDGDVTLQVGGRSLDALHTPGHTRGHYVFADRAAGLLFAGDHVLPTITPSIGFEPAYAAQPLGDFLASLAKVRALPDLRLLPAHGPVAGSTHTRIDELLAHHDERLERCRQAVLAGRDTAYGVAHDLPWTRHARHIDELGMFDAALAALETMAHLDLLVARGGLVATDAPDSGVRCYAPVPG